MTFGTAIKTCFRKYVTFSGRASRSEYWFFVLFLMLGSAAASAIDVFLFGTGSVETQVGEDSLEFATGGEGGPIAGLFGLATFLPSLAAGWRRMHDTGRSGLYLLYPLIVMVGIGMFASLTGALGGMMPDAGNDLTPLAGFTGAVLVFAFIVFLISPILVLWWLTRPSQPGANEYGPNPHEVTT